MSFVFDPFRKTIKQVTPEKQAVAPYSNSVNLSVDESEPVVLVPPHNPQQGRSRYTPLDLARTPPVPPQYEAFIVGDEASEVACNRSSSHPLVSSKTPVHTSSEGSGCLELSWTVANSLKVDRSHRHIERYGAREASRNGISCKTDQWAAAAADVMRYEEEALAHEIQQEIAKEQELAHTERSRGDLSNISYTVQSEVIEVSQLDNSFGALDVSASLDSWETSSSEEEVNAALPPAMSSANPVLTSGQAAAAAWCIFRLGRSRKRIMRRVLALWVVDTRLSLLPSTDRSFSPRVDSTVRSVAEKGINAEDSNNLSLYNDDEWEIEIEALQRDVAFEFHGILLRALCRRALRFWRERQKAPNSQSLTSVRNDEYDIEDASGGYLMGVAAAETQLQECEALIHRLGNVGNCGLPESQEAHTGDEETNTLECKDPSKSKMDYPKGLSAKEKIGSKLKAHEVSTKLLLNSSETLKLTTKEPKKATKENGMNKVTKPASGGFGNFEGDAVDSGTSNHWDDDIDDEVRLADDPPPWSQVDDDEIVGSEEVLIVQAKKTGAVFATAETNSSSSCIKYTSKSQRRVSFAISTTSNSEMIQDKIQCESV